MKRCGNMFSKMVALMVVGILCVSSLTVCLADAYSEYYNAYMATMENGLIDASLTADLTMDGVTTNYSGNMKIDAGKNWMYYEMTCNGQTIVTFTDGSYIYIEADGEKSKFTLNENAEDQSEPEAPEEQDQSQPEFTAQDFINNFSSVLEPGKISQLGLLDPKDKSVVSDVTRDGNVYTLEIPDSLAQEFLNIISSQIIADDSETVSFTNLQNFTYKATVEDGKVTGVVYGGELGVHVPGSLMSAGSDADYQLGFTINITFNNPGNESGFELPSTDGYEERKPELID